jgi:hypothetical protein
MKLRAATADLSTPKERREPVRIGGVYGDLEVVEEATPYPKTGERRYLCRCLRIVEGKPCGQTTVKKRTQVLDSVHGVRSCRECAQRSLREHRRAFSRGLTYR